MGPPTGILLGKDPSPIEVAALIEGVRSSAMGTPAFREQVRETWRAGFEAQADFNGFVDRVLQR